MRTIDIIKYRQGKEPAAVKPAISLEMARDLRAHLDLAQEILAVVEKEGEALRASEPVLPKPLVALKKLLLPRLTQSVERLRQHRMAWQKMSPEERAQHADAAALLRQNQEVIMKIILLDRENEQLLLRHGLVPPGQLPPSQRQRAGLVAGLYRHHDALKG